MKLCAYTYSCTNHRNTCRLYTASTCWLNAFIDFVQFILFLRILCMSQQGQSTWGTPFDLIICAEIFSKCQPIFEMYIVSRCLIGIRHRLVEEVSIPEEKHRHIMKIIHTKAFWSVFLIACARISTTVFGDHPTTFVFFQIYRGGAERLHQSYSIGNPSGSASIPKYAWLAKECENIGWKFEDTTYRGFKTQNTQYIQEKPSSLCE